MGEFLSVIWELTIAVIVKGLQDGGKQVSDETERFRRFLTRAAKASEDVAEFEPRNVDRLRWLHGIKENDARCDYRVRRHRHLVGPYWTPCGRKANRLVRVNDEDHSRCERHGG
jgi:hypothetical protein